MELEICVDSVESAIAAEAGGAQRVELCSALNDGGLTPSAGLIRAVLSRVEFAVYVMIRPRAGDFLYSADEYSIMRDDIAFAKLSGARGVVLGLLTPDGEIDLERTRALVDLARPMEVTFHRAIDMSCDLERSLEGVIQAGVDRVLSSGAAPTALLGAAALAKLVALAGGRVGVMAGGGVRPENIQKLARTTGVREFHASLRRPVGSLMSYRNETVRLGSPDRDEYARSVVVAEDVRALRDAMDAARAASSRS